MTRAFDWSSPGSSPHTRGALARRPLVLEAGGIIPAYAGSTVNLLIVSDLPPDHPRIRGEHVRTVVFARVNQGSSPHTRGARIIPDGPACRQGIIPAYAGSTVWRRRCR